MKVALRSAAALLGLTLFAAVLTDRFHPRAPAWYLASAPLREDEVNLEKIHTEWHDDVLWIDARPREQFDQAHIPGALLLNEYERDALIIEHMEVLQNPHKPVVVYCDGAACQASRKMREYLKENLAMPEVWVLQGGWKTWQAAQPAK